VEDGRERRKEAIKEICRDHINKKKTIPRRYAETLWSGFPRSFSSDPQDLPYQAPTLLEREDHRTEEIGWQNRQRIVLRNHGTGDEERRIFQKFHTRCRGEEWRRRIRKYVLCYYE